MGRTAKKATPIVPRLPSEAQRPVGEPVLTLYNRWLEHVGRGRAPKTLRNHERTRELAKALPEHPAPGDISVWLSALRSAGFGASTVDLHRWNLLAVYTYGRHAGWASCNPVALLPWKTAPEQEPRPCREIREVFPRILAAVPSEDEHPLFGARARAFCGVLRYCGVRIEEAMGLYPADVARDADGWRLCVVRQRPTVSSWHTSTPKGRGARRYRNIPIRPELRALLEPVLELAQPQVRVGRGGRDWYTPPFLFPYRGTERDRLRQLLADVHPKSFGDPGEAFHVLRHTFAWELAIAGKPIEQIQAALGHADLKTTQHYIGRLTGKEVPKALFDGL
jgi:integrase